ncbi:MAG: tetratricopeptide repeat protein [Paludibacteraceae bacterium]|nr:tetratricopeptide repeat protein [Paludibacteraceae bacterium]
MKKVFLAVAVLISTVSMAQIKDVKRVQGMISGEMPNFEAARELIKGTLTNEETKDQANTWYVAGLIGYQEATNEMNKMYMGSQVDYNVVGKAEQESYQYWLKADELAQVLVQDKKGNMVMDKKNVAIRKNIANKMVEYFQNQGLLGYAGSFYEQNDYVSTFELYKMYIEIPSLPFMQEEKIQSKLTLDTVYQETCFSAGQLAYSSEKYSDAAAIFAKMVKGDYKPINAGEYLYSCYLNMKDSAKAYEMMDMCIELFPNESRFMQARINSYVGQKDYDNAIKLLDKVIAQDPQAQYFNSKGSILSMQGKYDEAIATFKQGLEKEPNNAELYSNYGYVYVEKGNKLNDEAAYMKSDSEYQKMRKQIDDANNAALPLFEKAHQLDPDNYDYTRALKSLYYRLGMIEEYNALQ